MRRLITLVLCTGLGVSPSLAQSPATPDDGSALPFPPVPSASEAGPTLQDSTMVWRSEAKHLPDDAPNILIVMLDDVGFGLPETFGGDIHTPTLTRLANEGIAFNAFHTTSICSPSRAALLTGRNHHHVGSGTIAERALDWDGYVGVIPPNAATVAEVLHHYGYKTAAFGKWHNTPAIETTAMGPFDRWPTGYGFDRFYGFLAGETSQWEPRLVRDTVFIEPPADDSYHLTDDLADQAIVWLQQHRAYAPDQPFFLYFAPGAAHGPHHIFPEWADRYKGAFDDGWDAMRERIFARQKALGWIPVGTELTPRPDSLQGWDEIPESQRPFQIRLMEVFAGMVEHADYNVGRVVDELDRLGLRDDTLVIFIWGDNGSSAEGQRGSVSELLAQNNLPSKIEQHIAALDELGGLAALGSPAVDNIYHAGWAWAGDTPFRYTKLVASDFGGTRTPLVISWPGHIQHDATPRPQFHHLVDIVPTIYEILGIVPPEVVDGAEQYPLDGVSMVYSFADATAAGRKEEQYFENNGSRGLYLDGWFASTFGPLVPWDTAGSGAALKSWDATQDRWELFDLSKDFSLAHDLGPTDPQRLEAMQQRFLAVAEANQVFPVGGALWTRLHPEDRIKTPYARWTFDETTQRMPEFTAPGLGRESSRVSLDLQVADKASGVLYALGGASGGLALYLLDGVLVYEYNMMIIERYEARSAKELTAGSHRIEVVTDIEKPGGAARVTVRVDGQEDFSLTVDRTVPAAFTASETFDVGRDLGSPVSRAYEEQRPFTFEGEIAEMRVELK